MGEGHSFGRGALIWEGALQENAIEGVLIGRRVLILIIIVRLELAE